MRAVNLLSQDAARRSRLGGLGDRLPNAAALVAIAGGTVVATAVAAVMIVAGNQEAQKRDELDQRKIELALIPKPQAQSTSAPAGLDAAAAPRADAVSSALSSRVAWDRILRRFSFVLPDDVWLTTLSLKSPGGGAADPAAAAQAFSIAGYTYSHDSVAVLLSRLELVPDLSDVQLQSSTLTELGSRSVVQFTIAANVTGAAA